MLDDVGSLAEWVGAVGGLLAVIAAVVAWLVSKRLLELEQCRDDTRNAAAAREQAELIFALGAMLPQRDDPEKWAIYLHNGSTKPIYGVCVESQKLDKSATNHPLQLEAVPPGQFIVPSHPTFRWGALLDLDRIAEDMEFLVKGKGGRMITRMTFSDASRQRWELANGTELNAIAPR